MSVLLREAIGGSIRRARTERNRTLRDVSHDARVSLGYLSEIERGRKEPSSELLAAICEALALPLADLLDEVADVLRPVPSRPRPVAVLDPALRSAVEEALEPVGESGDASAEAAVPSAPSGQGGDDTAVARVAAVPAPGAGDLDGDDVGRAGDIGDPDSIDDVDGLDLADPMAGPRVVLLGRGPTVALRVAA